MRKTKIVNLRSFNILSYFGKNRIVLLLSFMFIAGVTLGTVMYAKNSGAQMFAGKIYDIYFSGKLNSSFIISALKWFAVLFAVSALFFISGTSMMGIVTVPLSLFAVGFILGDFSAFMYSLYSIKGVAFNAVIFIPPMLIFLITLITVCKCTLNFSYTIVKLTYNKSVAKNLSTDFKIYCGKYLILLAASLISALTDAALNNFFLKFFEF